jgi:hypothetical protein
VSNSLQWPETQFPPYSRAAATAYLVKEKIPQLTVFPSAKSAVIVGGKARYGLHVLLRQLHRGAKWHGVTKPYLRNPCCEILIAKFLL